MIGLKAVLTRLKGEFIYLQYCLANKKDIHIRDLAKKHIKNTNKRIRAKRGIIKYLKRRNLK